jgi:hypothetical protein
MHTTHNAALEPETLSFYRRALEVLEGAGVEVLVGGAYAFARYTGIERHTKDFDLFLRPRDAGRALEALGAAGYRSEVAFPHWLSKAWHGEDFVDLIHSSGNGAAPVDDSWFEHAVPDEVFGRPARLVAPEEMLWQKSLIMERERFDGADVNHLLRATAETLDWGRLIDHLGEYWRPLLAHLVMFGFVYPGERHRVPARVLMDLAARLEREAAAGGEVGLCRGTIVSRGQYLVDVETWGYRDGRIADGLLAPEDVARWTAAIERDGTRT